MGEGESRRGEGVKGGGEREDLSEGPSSLPVPEGLVPSFPKSLFLVLVSSSSSVLLVAVETPSEEILAQDCLLCSFSKPNLRALTDYIQGNGGNVT